MKCNSLIALLFACLVCVLAKPQIDGRIAGGYEARGNQFPYQVAIYIKTTGDAIPLHDDFCSGSLISQNYVLTAAHCIANAEEVTLVMGGTHLDVLQPEQVKIVSSEFIIPENFNSTFGAGYDWDIALIKLNTPVELADNIQLVQLAEGDDEYAGDIGIVAGWGASFQAQHVIEPVLRWIDSVILSFNQCIKDNPFYKQFVIKGSHICQLTETKSACHGDSGAPLVINGAQVGVVAFTPNNCFRQQPVIYARVAQYIDWIKENSDV